MCNALPGSVDDRGKYVLLIRSGAAGQRVDGSLHRPAAALLLELHEVVHEFCDRLRRRPVRGRLRVVRAFRETIDADDLAST